MMLRKCLIIFILSGHVVSAQYTIGLSALKSRIVSPVRHPIVLSGTYGELRSTHFHAGIDIRPSSANSDDAILAVDDGYISRIRVQTGGFGKSIYIVHPQTGYTTVYAHLDRFNEELERHVTKIQYARKSYAVNIDLPRNYFMVKKGQVIGYMGDTGQSFGTHLHFELRETATEKPVNPALAGLTSTDRIAPQIVNVAVHGLNQNFHKTEQIIISGENSRSSLYYNLPVVDIVSDRAGIAIEIFDQADGAPNKNGIYRLRLYDEKALKYSFEFNRFSFSESNQISGFIDYAVKQTAGNTYALCYRLPGNSLDFLKHNPTGIFDLGPGMIQYFCIEAEDFGANTTIFEGYIRKVETQVIQEHKAFQNIILFGQRYLFERDNCKITFHEESLFRNILFEYRMISDSECSHCYQIHEATEPIRKAIDLSFQIPESLNTKQNKVIVIRHDLRGKKWNHGGKVESDKINISSRFFGRYEVGIDSIAPTIRTVRFSRDASAFNEFVFEVKDDLDIAGNARDLKYEVFIDDKFVVCPFKSVTHTLRIPLRALSKGKHNLKINARDHSGNVSRFQNTFIM